MLFNSNQNDIDTYITNFMIFLRISAIFRFTRLSRRPLLVTVVLATGEEDERDTDNRGEEDLERPSIILPYR